MITPDFINSISFSVDDTVLGKLGLSIAQIGTDIHFVVTDTKGRIQTQFNINRFQADALAAALKSPGTT